MPDTDSDPVTHPDPPAAPTGTPATAACRELVADLADRWPLSSVHLLLDGRLRCMAASGYFRLPDGTALEAGLVARAVSTGGTVVADGVEPDADRPGVAAPVIVGGRCVGAVSIEGPAALDPHARADVESAARRLGESLRAQGGAPTPPVGQRLARLAVDLGAAVDVERLRRLVVEGAVGVAGRSSAALVTVSPGGSWQVVSSTGPLAQSISDWGDAELGQLAAWVPSGTSSGVDGRAPVPPGYQFLPRSGVRSLLVHPLVAGGEVTGLLAVADADPREHDPVAVAAVEVVAGLAASSLRTAGLLQEHADRARLALTGVADADALRDDLTNLCIVAIQTGAVTHTCMLLSVDDPQPVDQGRRRDASDEVLSALVEAVNGQLRHGDSLYRVEGPEFAVLLATGLLESAAAVATRLSLAARNAGAPVVLGWALVEGPPAAVRKRAAVALREAKDAAAPVPVAPTRV